MVVPAPSREEEGWRIPLGPWPPCLVQGTGDAREEERHRRSCSTRSREEERTGAFRWGDRGPYVLDLTAGAGDTREEERCRRHCCHRSREEERTGHNSRGVQGPYVRCKEPAMPGRRRGIAGLAAPGPGRRRGPERSAGAIRAPMSVQWQDAGGTREEERCRRSCHHRSREEERTGKFRGAYPRSGVEGRGGTREEERCRRKFTEDPGRRRGPSDL